MNGPVVLGFGCERGIREPSVREGIVSFLDQRGRDVSNLVRVATLTLKSDEEGLLRAVRGLDCELVFYTAEQLSAVGPPPNPSPVVKRCVGVSGVCEPAALRASGARKLTAEKTVLRPGEKNMTLAMAISVDPNNPAPSSTSDDRGGPRGRNERP